MRKIRVRDKYRPSRLGTVVEQGAEVSVVVWDALPHVRQPEPNEHLVEVTQP